MSRSFIIFLILSIITAILFIAVPEIDLYVSRWFYVYDVSPLKRFFWGSHWSVVFLFDLVTIATAIMIIAFISGIIIESMHSYVLKRPGHLWFKKRVLLYLAFSLAIGPGLIVNEIFKNQWGRARPYKVEEFAGVHKFSPAFVMSDQCPTNCSFVAGHASIGFFGYAFALLANRRRNIYILLSTAAGSIVGAARIVQGAHFLSDIIFSGVIMYMTCYGLHYLFFRHPTIGAADEDV